MTKTVEEACVAAEVRHSGLRVSRTQFASFLRDKALLANGQPLAHGGDLAFAFCCARGDAIAIAAFETTYVPPLVRLLKQQGFSLDLTDEAVQRLRTLLLVGDDDSPPKITDYKGHGPLDAWLRVTGTRLARKLITRDKLANAEGDDVLLETRTMGDDPELAFIKGTYRGAFRQAFREALTTLEPRARTLLKQHTIDGLSIDALAPIHGVHRATVARWLQQAQVNLLNETRTRFMKLAKLAPEECESVLRMVESRLDVTYRRLSDI